MKKFDVTELNYVSFKEMVEQVKEVHNMDITKRFKTIMDLVDGDPYLVDGKYQYFVTEIGFRNYFPIVAKIEECDDFCGIVGFALGW